MPTKSNNQPNVARYQMFPDHGDLTAYGGRYHSDSLPLPNVIRIEVLSPNARMRYLGKFHGTMEKMRNSIMESMLTPDALEPFYGFFDPEKVGDLGFDVNANWSPAQHTGMDALATMVEKVPVVGKVGGLLRAGSGVAQKMANMAGMDTNSTGSCTLKEFGGASFNFHKDIDIVWYMPEQEDMARVGVARLLKMAYVRNLDTTKTNDYAKKLAGAFKVLKDEVTTAIPGANGVIETAGNIADMAGAAANFVGDISGFNTSGIVLPSVDDLINGAMSINTFLGGALTINPFPVRLTLGHQLDIEPLVITGVRIHGSKEQFMTTDGSNIPLFVTASVSFDMWMTPDPNKGFVKYLGDDVFNVGYSAGAIEYK